MSYTWLIFAFLSAITAALVAIFGKIGLQDVDPNTATAVRAIVMAIFLVGFIAVEGKISQISSIASNWGVMKYIVISGIAGALSWLFYFIALKLGSASQVASIDRLSIVFVIIFALLFLGEKLTLKVGVGAALVSVGAIIIALG